MANLLLSKPETSLAEQDDGAGQLKQLVKGTDFYNLAVSMNLVPEQGHAGILYGRFYVTKSGYSYFGRKNNVTNIRTDIISAFSNAKESDWAVKATITVEGRGTFDGTSRAYPGNVTRAIFGTIKGSKRDKCLETAETHAIRRAFQNAFPELIPLFSDEGEEEIKDAVVVDSATGTVATEVKPEPAAETNTPSQEPDLAQTVAADEPKEEGDSDDKGEKKFRMTKRRKTALEGLKALVTQHGEDFQDALAESLESNYGTYDLEKIETDKLEEALDKATAAMSGASQATAQSAPAPAPAAAPAISDRNEALLGPRSGWLQPKVGTNPGQLPYPKCQEILVSVTGNPQRIRLDKLTEEEWKLTQQKIEEALTK